MGFKTVCENLASSIIRILFTVPPVREGSVPDIITSRGYRLKAPRELLPVKKTHKHEQRRSGSKR